MNIEYPRKSSAPLVVMNSERYRDSFLKTLNTYIEHGTFAFSNDAFQRAAFEDFFVAVAVILVHDESLWYKFYVPPGTY